jgi:hypothetical protein
VLQFDNSFLGVYHSALAEALALTAVIAPYVLRRERGCADNPLMWGRDWPSPKLKHLGPFGSGVLKLSFCPALVELWREG